MSDKKTISQPAIISGMEIETAKKYIEARKSIDDKVCKLSSLGWAIQKISNSNYRVEDEEVHLSYLGDIIQNLTDSIYGELDEFASTSHIHLALNDRGKAVEVS